MLCACLFPLIICKTFLVKGKAMETDNCENLSRQIFLHLCRVIGSKKVVHSRRVFFHVMDAVKSEKKKHAFVSSGSKAEGLNIPGSDVDFMVVLKSFLVCHDSSEIDGSIGLTTCITDTEHAPPGFVYLKVIPERNRNGGVTLPDYGPVSLITKSDYGPVLSNQKFKDCFLREYQKIYGNMCNIHGPCISICSTRSEIEEQDHAFCVRSYTWPNIAEGWLKRPRNFRWPPSNLEEMLAIHGLLYVPIGSKFGAKENNPLQWRMSFSIQEKLLIYSFNHTQLLCYALLKLLLKEVINTQANTSNLLCSYFMKTIVFWISEEVEISEWRPECLLRCLNSCIKRLLYFINLGYCPNYFIPENNMFEGKIYGKNQQNLSSVVQNIIDRDIHAILTLPTLIHFIPGEISLINNVLQNGVDVGLYPLLNKFTSFSAATNPGVEISSLLTKLGNRNSSLYKSLYLLFLAHKCMHNLTIMSYNWQCSNKHFYQQYKQKRFFALIGKNIDRVSGWLWFATFLYQHKHYHNALVVVSSILRECTPDKIYITVGEPREIDCNDTLSAKRSSFLQRHKLFCIHQMCMIPQSGSVFHNSDLSYSNVNHGIVAPPIVYLHYLRFLCFHCLGNISERNKCITDIELTIENEFFVSSCSQRIVSNIYLLKALKIYHDCIYD